MSIKKVAWSIIVILLVSDSLIYIAGSGVGGATFTSFSLICKYIVLSLFLYVIRKGKGTTRVPKPIQFAFSLFLGWNLVTIMHGALCAENYLDWKFLLLSSLIFLLLPLVFFMGKSLLMTRFTFYFFVRYACTYSFLLLPLARITNEELYARLMIPISFFIVCLPYLKTRDRLMVILVAIVSLISVLDLRTNIIKISISALILATFYIRFIFSDLVLKVIHLLLFILPLTLLSLGVLNGYNIFEKLSENEGYEVQKNSGDKSNLTADTRTFLYVEVFRTLNRNNSWLIGEGATGKYKSVYFTDLVTGDERYGTEVGFLNTLLYSGIIGVILYFLILLLSSYYAIYNSKNRLCKLLGIIIASRWVLFFLEEFTQLDMNFYFLWIFIALISSNSFRNLKEADIKQFFDFKPMKKSRMAFDKY